MSGLSDVLGGVYNGDDPTPDHHDTTALEERPEVDDDEAPGAVWDLADDADDAEQDDAAVQTSAPAAPAPAPELALDDDFDFAPRQPASSDDGPGPAVTEPADAPVWDLDSPVDDPDLDWATEDPVSWDASGDDGATHAPAVDTEDETISARSFGMLSATALAGDPESTDADGHDGEGEAAHADAGPWLRTDDDILPSKRKRGLAFWRR